MNFYETYYLLMAVKKLTPASTFLRDRYFPTNDATDLFSSKKVLVEYKDGTKRLAPIVSSHKRGVMMERTGSEIESFAPPKIAPEREVTIDDLEDRGFGEALFSAKTPEQREKLLLLQDYDYLDEVIARREEAICAEVIQTNGAVLSEITDKKSKAEQLVVKYYSENTNPAQYAPGTSWDAPGADILGDLKVMVRMLTSRGLPATELIVSPSVADAIQSNGKILELMDNRRVEMGSIAPEVLPEGAAKVCRLNVGGRFIDVISYDETYTSDSGVDTAFIDEQKAILTAPAAGRTLYGAHSQIEQKDNERRTYTAKRVPQYVADVNGNSRSLTVSSHPLPIPNNRNPFITATALF